MYRRNPTPRKIALPTGDLGLEFGECPSLQWGDFDLKLGTLNINGTAAAEFPVETVPSKVVIQTPKPAHLPPGNSNPETVFICGEAARKRQQSLVVLSGSESKPTSPHCYRKASNVWGRGTCPVQVRPHTCATPLQRPAGGCDVKTLSELLGHANANGGRLCAS